MRRTISLQTGAAPKTVWSVWSGRLCGAVERGREKVRRGGTVALSDVLFVLTLCIRCDLCVDGRVVRGDDCFE